MALFDGEELIDVPTPDGRVLKLPRSIVPASMMPQQVAPAGPIGPTSYTPETPNTEVPSVTGGQLPTEQPQVVETAPAQNSPDYVAGTVDNRPETIAAGNKAAEKQRKAQAAAAASPQGKLDTVQGKQEAAQGKQESAILNQATVEGATQDVMAHAVEARNTAIDQIQAKKAADLQKVADQEDAAVARTGGIRQKIANTKIDRSADHPVMGFLFAALAGLGQAIDKKTGPNPALEAYYQAIDRKVAAQMGDLDQLMKTYDMSKDEVTDLREKSKRKLEFYNSMVAGEIDKGARALEEISAKSASDKTKASAKAMIADLQARAADKQAEAVHWGLDYDQKDRHQRQQIALGYAGIREQRYATDLNAQLKREDMYLDQQKYLAGLKAKGDEEAYKAQLKQTEEVGKRGVRDMNGDPLMSASGKAKLDQAAQLEDQAKQLEDAGKSDLMGYSVKGGKTSVELMRQKAAQLRGEASLNDVVMAHSDTEAVTVSNMMASGQSTIQLIDGIKTLADKAGRGAIGRDQLQAELQSMFQQLAPNLKEAWQLGAWDKGSAKLVETIIGADPSSDWNAGTLGAVISGKMIEDPKSYKARLDSVASGLERAAKNRLVNLGAKYGVDDKVFTRSNAPAVTSSDKESAALSQGFTGTEREQNAEKVGVAGKIARKVGYPFSPSIAQEAEANKSVQYPGLGVEQEKPFTALLQSYKGGNVKDGEELVAKVANSAADRPELSIALLHNLREHAPALYTKARELMPADSPAAQQMDYEEKNRIGAATVPTPMLTNTVLQSIDSEGKVTDLEGYREIARRAGQGDETAKTAILQIVKQSGANRTLPKGSVFREGR